MVDAAELQIDTTVSEEEMAETIFGAGVQIVEGSVSYSGDPSSSGVFTGGLTTSEGFAPSDTGLILSTGQAQSVTNSSGEANQNTNTSTNTAGGIDGDADFNAAANQSTFDAAFIEASFIPEGETLTMQFVFGSEEYPEFVNAGFNDTIGVWVNGQQVELSVGQGQTSVDAVNPGKNANLYVDNTQDAFNTEMDGFTVVLSLKAPVMKDAVNTIKIGIADAGDSVFDSNLLIAADSVQSSVIAEDDTFSVKPDEAVTVDLLANDSPNGTLEITHINGQEVFVDTPITLPSGETITLNEDGTVTVMADGDVGANTFAYTVSDEDGVTDTAVATILTEAPCFTTGAQIETENGLRAIEDLSIGDWVVTRDDGLQQIRWIGRKTVRAKSGKTAPIRFSRHTLGAARSFLVSPQHRMVVSGWRAQVLFGSNEVLARAKDLVDGEAVTSEPAEKLDYWHLLFDRHQVVYADGVPSESFHPGDESLCRIDEAAREEVFALFPQLRADPSVFGPAARLSLKSHEARLLMSG